MVVTQLCPACPPHAEESHRLLDNYFPQGALQALTVVL